MNEFDYKQQIVPVIQLLCESDQGNEEANFGQMSEVVKKLALLIKKDPTIIDLLVEYSNNLETE